MKIVAICQSYYHFAQTLGLCHWLQLQGVKPDLTVYRGIFLGSMRIKRHAIDLTRVTHPVIIRDAPRPKRLIMPLAVTRLVLSSLRRGPHHLALVSPNGPHLGLLSAMAATGDAPDSFYSIEDGIGTYGGVVHRAKAKAMESGRTLWFPVFLLGEVIKDIMLRVTTLQSGGVTFTLGTRTVTTTRTQINLAPHVKTILTAGVFRHQSHPIPKNTVLFLSQPYVDIGLIKQEAYVAVLNAVRSHFGSLGKELLIKPHPAESIDILKGFQICNFEGPVEALFGHYEKSIDAVVGINSTALLLSRRLFDLPTYRVEHRFLSEINNAITDRAFHAMLEEVATALPLD